MFLESFIVLVSESKTLLQVIIWIHILEKILIISTSLSSGATSDQRKNSMRILTASIYYVITKVNGFVLLDVDMLPLQGEHWQMDQMLSAYFSLLASRFWTPLSLKFNLDFTSVGSIVTGTGVKKYLATGSTAEILDASDSLQDLCAKCGRKLTNTDGPLLTC